MMADTPFFATTDRCARCVRCGRDLAAPYDANVRITCGECIGRPFAIPAEDNHGRTPFAQALDDILALHDKKQRDYGRDTDPFANVRASEDFGVDGWKGCLIRANDKMRRLQTYCQKGTLANEGVEDSLIDLATYATIALVLWREQCPDAK